MGRGGGKEGGPARGGGCFPWGGELAIASLLAVRVVFFPGRGGGGVRATLKAEMAQREAALSLAQAELRANQGSLTI